MAPPFVTSQMLFFLLFIYFIFLKKKERNLKSESTVAELSMHCVHSLTSAVEKRRKLCSFLMESTARLETL